MKKLLIFILVLCLAFVACDNSPVIENESSSEVELPSDTESPSEQSGYEYILNTSTLKYHAQFCPVIPTISEKNKATTTNIAFYIERGYAPCERCILREAD